MYMHLSKERNIVIYIYCIYIYTHITTYIYEFICNYMHRGSL